MTLNAKSGTLKHWTHAQPTASPRPRFMRRSSIQTYLVLTLVLSAQHAQYQQYIDSISESAISLSAKSFLSMKATLPVLRLFNFECSAYTKSSTCHERTSTSHCLSIALVMAWSRNYVPTCEFERRCTPSIMLPKVEKLPFKHPMLRRLTRLVPCETFKHAWRRIGLATYWSSIFPT